MFSRVLFLAVAPLFLLMQIYLKINQSHLKWLFWSPIINAVSKRFSLIFVWQNMNVQMCIYIFTYWCCLSLQHTAAFFIFLAASSNFTSSPECVHFTDHLVKNFDNPDFLWCLSTASLNISWDLQVPFFQSKLQNLCSVDTIVRLEFIQKETQYDNAPKC